MSGTEVLQEEQVCTEKDIESVANSVVRSRMAAPAIVFLELIRPFSRISSQLLIVSIPLLIPLFGTVRTAKVQQIISSPEALEQLIRRIEELESERSA